MAWQRYRNALTSAHFRDTVTGQRRADFRLGTVLHYGEQFANDIDIRPQRVNVAALDGWRVQLAGWHFAMGIPGDKGGQDGWTGFSPDAGSHWFRWRLVRGGYMHLPTGDFTNLSGAPDYDRANLAAQQDQSLILGPQGAEVEYNALSTWRWSSVFTGVHLDFQLEGRRLKQNVVLTAAARNALPAPSTPAAQTHFGWVFEIDHDTRMVKNGSDATGDYDDTDGRIEMRSASDVLLAAMPLDHALAGGEAIPLRKRIYTDPGDSKRYLLVSAPVGALNNLPAGAITFDPQLDTQPDATAGKDTWVRSGASSTFNYGVMNLLDHEVTNRKSLVMFNCESIPADATCDDATLTYTSQNSVGAATIQVFPVAAANGDWAEGDKNGSAPTVAEGSTWDEKHAIANVNWAGAAGCNTAGTDYDAQFGTMTWPASSPDTDFSTALTASVVETWFGSATNNGLLSKLSSGTNPRAVHSSDASTASFRPQLVVNYTLPGSLAPRRTNQPLYIWRRRAS